MKKKVIFVSFILFTCSKLKKIKVSKSNNYKLKILDNRLKIFKDYKKQINYYFIRDFTIPSSSIPLKKLFNKIQINSFNQKHSYILSIKENNIKKVDKNILNSQIKINNKIKSDIQKDTILIGKTIQNIKLTKLKKNNLYKYIEILIFGGLIFFIAICLILNKNKNKNKGYWWYNMFVFKNELRQVIKYTKRKAIKNQKHQYKIVYVKPKHRPFISSETIKRIQKAYFIKKKNKKIV